MRFVESILGRGDFGIEHKAETNGCSLFATGFLLAFVRDILVS
jgi:hypothetical protein